MDFDTLSVLAILFIAFPWVLFHYITKGPNDVSKELEDEMEHQDRAAEKEQQP